jgi:hypothetical protein
MTKEKVKAVLARVSSWPEERQQKLAELALEIEAELAGVPYRATNDELEAIDEGLVGEPASDQEVAAAFAKFRRA